MKKIRRKQEKTEIHVENRSQSKSYNQEMIDYLKSLITLQSTGKISIVQDLKLKI